MPGLAQQGIPKARKLLEEECRERFSSVPAQCPSAAQLMGAYLAHDRAKDTFVDYLAKYGVSKQHATSTVDALDRKARSFCEGPPVRCGSARCPYPGCAPSHDAAHPSPLQTSPAWQGGTPRRTAPKLPSTPEHGDAGQKEAKALADEQALAASSSLQKLVAFLILFIIAAVVVLHLTVGFK